MFKKYRDEIKLYELFDIQQCDGFALIKYTVINTLIKGNDFYFQNKV